MTDRLRPADALHLLGGVSTWAELSGATSGWAVRAAVADGTICRVGHGRYSLPALPTARACAERLCGVVSHESAAQSLGLQTVSRASRVHVTVPRERRLRRRAADVQVHWQSLHPSEIDGWRTTPLRTVLDCARTLPFVEGLAVADSAARAGMITRDELVSAACALRGAGRGKVIRVADMVDGRAASVLESALRGVLLEAGLRDFEPQYVIADGDMYVRVDLADAGRRIVLEADSFEHHGSRGALARDCRRYNELVLRQWRVLRFAWEHVMFEADWVVGVVRSVSSTSVGPTLRTPAAG